VEFHRRIKGILTQGLVQALLEDAGYQVRPLGVEEQFSDLKDASPKLYRSIFKGLRSAPDFLVLDSRNEQSWLVEVKYRKRWDSGVVDALHPTLSDQATHWQEFLFWVFLGENTSNPSDLCRVFRVRHVYGKMSVESAIDKGRLYPWDKAEWKHAFPVGQMFPLLNTAKGRKALETTMQVSFTFPIIFDGE
jgi:hypothetical protein